METITANQVTYFAKSCLLSIQELTNYRITKAQNQQLSLEEDKDLENKQNLLFELANKLNAKAIDLKVQDLKDATEEISKATKKIDKALDELKETRRIIGAITGLVELFTSLVTAVTTGSPATIANAINNIEKFV